MTIEMATNFDADDEYFVHHRMQVNPGDHLDAFRDHSDCWIGFDHCGGGGDVATGGSGSRSEWGTMCTRSSKSSTYSQCST